jgi:hypothetical protein
MAKANTTKSTPIKERISRLSCRLIEVLLLLACQHEAIERIFDLRKDGQTDPQRWQEAGSNAADAEAKLTQPGVTVDAIKAAKFFAFYVASGDEKQLESARAAAIDAWFAQITGCATEPTIVEAKVLEVLIRMSDREAVVIEIASCLEAGAKIDSWQRVFETASNAILSSVGHAEPETMSRSGRLQLQVIREALESAKWVAVRHLFPNPGDKGLDELKKAAGAAWFTRLAVKEAEAMEGVAA